MVPLCQPVPLMCLEHLSNSLFHPAEGIKRQIDQSRSQDFSRLVHFVPVPAQFRARKRSERRLEKQGNGGVRVVVTTLT